LVVLIDTFGRTATDLRVSLTDRCNLRCTYCMPAEGLDWLPKPTLLTDDEIVRLARIAVLLLGVREIRFTGGEPLLRRGLVDILTRIASLTPRPRLAISTNGLGLARLAGPLQVAGLDRVNVSLDTVRPDTFLRLTRRDRLADVIAGLAAAHACGLRPVKVNAVLMRGINDQEGPELLSWCLGRGYELRFIEQMPLDAQHGWRREDMVTAAEILQMLSRDFDLAPEGQDARGSAPAETWLVNGGPGRVGIVGTVTRPFCAACARTRLTADGQVRNCLFAKEESDLRTPMRAGATDEELAEMWVAAMWAKKAGAGVDSPEFLQPARPMSAIGG
jgi:cyclic pyranopterin phosphate synthase